MNLVNPPAQHPLLNDRQRFQHDTVHQIDRYGSIVGEVRIDGNGAVIPPSDPPTLAQRSTPGGVVAIDPTKGTPLKTEDYLCQAVQITAVRSDWTDNLGRVGVGDVDGWYAAFDAMGTQLIEAPIGGVLNLKNVYVYGNTLGDQVHFLVFNTI
ncbi:MAG: hypothetical protein ACRC62_19990 [Microcoleus sp.]